jgi:hypothetical protein
MDDHMKSVSGMKAFITDADMSALINLAELHPDKSSPLAQVNAKDGAHDNRRLRQSGLIDGNNRPTGDCLEAMTILSNPDVELNLLWGAPDRVSLSKVYYSAHSGKLVSFTKTNGSCNLSYFLSFQDITDLISEKTAFPPIKDATEISLEAVPLAALPVFLSALDLYRESQLRGALERRTETEVKVSTAELNRIWQDSKMETNFSWYAPAGFIAMTDSLPVAPTGTEEGLNALKGEGLISQESVLSDRVSSFASRAFPLMSFFGVKALSKQGDAVDKVQLALFRGIATLLFVQISSEGGQELVAIKSLNTSQLPEILFNLVTLPFEIKPPAEIPIPSAVGTATTGITCGKCQTANPAGAKFCIKCGSTLIAAPTAKFCPKCGDPISSGEKFCNKCGNKLA